MLKLFHRSQKALSHIWKSFTTTVKQLRSNENQMQNQRESNHVPTRQEKESLGRCQKGLKKWFQNQNQNFTAYYPINKSITDKNRQFNPFKTRKFGSDLTIGPKYASFGGVKIREK